MQERIDKLEVDKYELEEVDNIRKEFLHRIRKYEKGYLKEELSGIPKHYITTSGGISPDEALQELRDRFGVELDDEGQLKEFLRELDTRKSALEGEIETLKPQIVSQKETTILKGEEKIIGQMVRQKSTEIRQLIAEHAKVTAKLQRRAFVEGKIEGKESESISRKIQEARKNAREAFKAEVRNIVRGIEDLPLNNLPIEYRERIEEIKNNFDLHRRSAKTLLARERMKNFVEYEESIGNDVNISQEKLDLLEKIPLNEMTFEELQGVSETIKRLPHQGMLKQRLLTAQGERNFSEFVQEAVKSITGGEGLKENASFIKQLQEQNKTLKNKGFEAIRDYIIRDLRPELMIKFLDGGKEGLLYNALWKPLYDSSLRELDNGHEAIVKIREAIKDLNLEEILVRKYTVGRFKGVKKDALLAIYSLSKNEKTLAHLLGSGITEEDIGIIERFLSPKEKQAADNILRYFDQYQHPQIASVYEKVEGVRFPKEQNYFPTGRVEDISYAKELERSLLERGYAQKAAVQKGFTKSRVGSIKGLEDISFIDTLLHNYTRVQHYVAFEESIRNARKILYNPEIKNAIKQQFGEEYWKTLDKWVKDVGYGSDAQIRTSLDKISRFIRTNYMTSVLGLNILSIAKSGVSLLQGAEFVGKGATLRAIGEVILNPFGIDKEIDGISSFMRHRKFSSERELREIISKRTSRQRIAHATGLQKLKELSMWPYVLGDKLTVDIIWKAAYDKATRNGISGERAKELADTAVRRTQPVGTPIHLPERFREGEVQKLFTLFRNQPNQNFNLLVESIFNKKAGNINVGEFASNIIWYALIPAYLLGLLSTRKSEGAKDYAIDVLDGALGGMFLAGNFISLLSFGSSYGSITPLEGLLKDTASVFTSKKPETKLKAGLRVGANLTGFPYIGLDRLFTGNIMGMKKEKQTIRRDQLLQGRGEVAGRPAVAGRGAVKGRN